MRTVGNALVAFTKIGAAVWTGSSKMMSEAVHSVVDTTNEVLLLYGYHRASRPPDESHPLGYGRELYFGSFIVALLIFALGAGASLYQGVLHVIAPGPIEDPIVSFVVLGLSFVFEGISWLFAGRRFRSETSRLGWYEAFVRSKDPPAFMALLRGAPVRGTRLAGRRRLTERLRKSGCGRWRGDHAVGLQAAHLSGTTIDAIAEFGKVDHLDGADKIKLTKQSSPDGQHHHFIPLSWVDRVDPAPISRHTGSTLKAEQTLRQRRPNSVRAHSRNGPPIEPFPTEAKGSMNGGSGTR